MKSFFYEIYRTIRWLIRGDKKYVQEKIFYHLTTPSIIYDKVRSLFTWHFKFVLLLIFISAWIFSVVKMRYEVFTNINLYFYFFSTIVQGFLALIAVLGTFVVFKLQLLETDLRPLVKELAEILSNYHGPFNRNTSNPISVMEKVKTLFHFNTFGNRSGYKGTQLHEGVEIEERADSVDWLIHTKGRIINQSRGFFFLALVSVTSSLIFIPFSDMFSRNPLGGSIAILFVTYICLLSIRLVWSLIVTMLSSEW